MAIVTQAANTWVQGRSYVAYDNKCLNPLNAVVASHEDSGFPITNGVQWTSYDKYKGSTSDEIDITLSLPDAQVVNSFGIFKHNLGTLGLNIKLQYSLTAGGAWVDAITAVNAPNDETIFRITTTDQAAAFWRLRIQGFGTLVLQVVIGSLFIGNALRLFGGPESGFVVPTQAIDDKFIGSKSDGGDFLGRSIIRKGGKAAFKMSAVSDDWVRANWEPFRVAANLHPFFYSWDSVNHPDEAVFCLAEKPSHPKYTSPLRQSVDMRFSAQ